MDDHQSNRRLCPGVLSLGEAQLGDHSRVRRSVAQTIILTGAYADNSCIDRKFSTDVGDAAVSGLDDSDAEGRVHDTQLQVRG